VQKNNAVPHAHAFCSLFFGFVATQKGKQKRGGEDKESKNGEEKSLE